MAGKNLALTLGAASLGAWLAIRALRSRAVYELRGKVALITGGARGLGLVLARQMAREGARLAICARDSDELDRARHDLVDRGATVVAVPCDLRDRAQVQSMIETIRRELGPVDVLVNNAGIISVGPVETMKLEDFEEAMRSNFWSAVYTILEVLPEMRRRHSGRIVNITSIGGKVSVPHLLPYGASKFALVGLSEGLRAELASESVMVTTVCPGLMRTGSPRNALFKGQHRAEFAWFSIGDSLPVASMSAERAARQIVEACKKGTAEVVLSLPAKCAVAFHGLFPGLTADLLGLVNRGLPGPGGIGQKQALGKESQSFWAPSWLTILTERAARRNNEISNCRPQPLAQSS
ncbi:MAG TPA: SDR family oxidoreductase [Gemmataceae bacterium]|nr:SDR family oxidoreductase [Gemmataceae bacterium]